MAVAGAGRMAYNGMMAITAAGSGPAEAEGPVGAVLAWRTGAGREVGRYMLVLCTFRVCFLLCVRVPDILGVRVLLC